MDAKRYGRYTEEEDAWLTEHRGLKGKMHTWEEFMKAFPGSRRTANGLSSRRTLIGAWGTSKHGGKKPCPLYTEKRKKDRTYIKVSATEWWSKSKWVWVATHPGEPFAAPDQFMHLDHDLSNFSPDNIRRVSGRTISLLNSSYYKEYLQSYGTKLEVLLLMIELRLMTLDRGEDLGLVVSYGSGRCFRSERAEAACRSRKKRIQREP